MAAVFRNKIYRTCRNRGASVLLLVLGVSAALVLLSSSLADIGFRDLDSAAAGHCGDKALLAAESCVEEALRRVQLDPSSNTQGTTVLIGEGSCVYSC